VAAVLADPVTTDSARQACEPTAGRWVSAARHGLDDRVLRRAAVTVFELALAGLPRLHAPSWVAAELAVMLERGVRRGLCPADRDAPDPYAPTPRVADLHPFDPFDPADVPEEART